jgi:hypothetical protein
VPSAPAFTPVDAADQPVHGFATIAIPAGAATTVIKSRQARLSRIVVTTAGTTGITTFYDNAATGAGTVIAVVPAAAALGTVISVDMPASNGIVAVGAAASAALTVSYS